MLFCDLFFVIIEYNLLCLTRKVKHCIIQSNQKYMDSTKIKELFVVACMAVGIILALILVVWLPFKVIPALFSGSTNFVASTLTENFIGDKSTSTKQTTTTQNNSTITTTTHTNTQTSQPVYSRPAYYGNSDLQVELVSEGVTDSNGQYYNTNSANSNNTVIVKFKVKNIGTNVSGSWTLRLNTPDYSSNYDTTHNSINPGDAILFTTTFHVANSGTFYTNVVVDPQNYIAENSENNNSLSVPITTNGSYNGVIINNNSNISAYCYATPQTAYLGNEVIWRAVVSGGNGTFTYSWQGTDSLFGNNNTAGKAYYVSGQKIANVTVYSNGQSTTVSCSANVY